jgi:hypothetical protein
MVIIDFKSSKEAYVSQFIQIGGYDIAASENGIFDAQGNFLLKLERPIDGYIVFPVRRGTGRAAVPICYRRNQKRF